MSHASLHRLSRRVTRAQLERQLGGEWEQDKADPTRRRNGRWETYKDARLNLKAIRNLRSGAVRHGRTWGELATALKAVVKR